MTHFLVVPAIDPHNTSAFLAAVAPDIARQRIVLIDNTDDGSIADAVEDQVLTAVRNERNAGVSASWNTGIQIALELDADFITLCSTSIRFTDWARGLCRTADLAAENSQWPYGFESMNGWHCITFTPRFFDELGLFDEKFWPAYYEDNDMIWRARCAGILEPAGGDRAARKIPWIGALKADLVGTAQAVKKAGVTVDWAALQAYYAEKWGGLPGEEQFVVPFDGGKP